MICSGCVSTTPLAISITTPSVIIALLSATIGLALSGVNSCGLQRGVAGFQHVAQGADGKALLQPIQFGKLWREHAVHQHQPARALDRLQLHSRCSPLQRSGIRCGRQRQHFAHQRAQIGVFPVLDAAGAAGPHGHRPRRRHFAPRRPCRCPAAGRARRRSCRSARVRSRSLPKPNSSRIPSVRLRLRTGRSRKPRAPAPDPCRRFSRPGPSTSRARSQARCS